MGVAVMELWAEDSKWSLTAPGKDLMEFMIETMRALMYQVYQVPWYDCAEKTYWGGTG